MALVQHALLGSEAILEWAHDGSAIQSPTDLDLGSRGGPSFWTNGLPPGTDGGHWKTQGFHQTQWRSMVVVVPVGVTMTTAVVEQPSHSLLRMFVNEEHGVHSDADHTTHFLQFLGLAGQGGIGQVHFEVAHTWHEGTLRLSLQPPTAASAAAATAAAAFGGVATTTTTAATTTTTTSSGAIMEVRIMVVPECKDI